MTSDGLVVLASEVGVLDIDPATVIRKGRLQPGRIFLADTAAGRIVEDEEVEAALAAEHPYEAWLHAGLIHLDDLPDRPRPGWSALGSQAWSTGVGCMGARNDRKRKFALRMRSTLLTSYIEQMYRSLQLGQCRPERTYAAFSRRQEKLRQGTASYWALASPVCSLNRFSFSCTTLFDAQNLTGSSSA